jgi:CrcB protein
MASMNTLSSRRRLLAVLGGGFCGTITRYLESGFIQAHLGKSWPYDILCINITGAFLLAFATTLADTTLLLGPTRRLFLNVGFLGAYTTFSSLALGDVLLAAGGNVLAALVYLALSLTGGVVAVLLGDVLAQWCVATVGRLVSPKPVGTRKLTGTLAASPFPTRVGDSQSNTQEDLPTPNTREERPWDQPR